MGASQAGVGEEEGQQQESHRDLLFARGLAPCFARQRVSRLCLAKPACVPDFIFPRQRYQCLRCGKSCQGWKVPVDGDCSLPGELTRKEEGVLVLAQDRLGRCRSLRPDNLCQLVLSSGARWPRACRQFPFFLTETPEGVFVGVSFRCSAVQQDRGVAWEEHLSDLEALYSLGVSRAGFEAVPLGSRKGLHWEIYREWEREWLVELELGSGLFPSVHRFLQPWLGYHEQALEAWLVSRSRQALVFLESAGVEQSQGLLKGLSRGQLLEGRRGQLVPGSFSLQEALHPEVARYLIHLLERKALWAGRDFLGSLLMVLLSERLMGFYLRSLSFGEAVDVVEGEWLTHSPLRGDREVVLAASFLPLCLEN